jgi:MATE family multidrug resistance protein
MGPEEIDRKWEEAVTAGLINTTWRRETEVIVRYSAPLMVTFLLQYSLTVASIFSIGHLGKEELGAVSLASMTVSITGNAVYSGLATSLDTLCAQAFGSGKKKLVGLQMLRMIYFLLVVTIPIATLWYFSGHILAKIVPEKRVAEMAGLYMKVALLGLPGYACFESGKRYLQAQGVFSASLYVLIICAPLNAFMNWFFVWVSAQYLTFSVSSILTGLFRNFNGVLSVPLSPLSLPRLSYRSVCLHTSTSALALNVGAALPDEPSTTGAP